MYPEEEIKNRFEQTKYIYMARTGGELDKKDYESNPKKYYDFSEKALRNSFGIWFKKNKLKVELFTMAKRIFGGYDRYEARAYRDEYIARGFFMDDITEAAKSHANNFIQKYNLIKDKKLSDFIEDKEILGVAKLYFGKRADKQIEKLKNSDMKVGEFLNHRQVKKSIVAYFLTTDKFKIMATAAGYIIGEGYMDVNTYEKCNPSVTSEYAYEFLEKIADKFGRKRVIKDMKERDDKQKSVILMMRKQNTRSV